MVINKACPSRARSCVGRHYCCVGNHRRHWVSPTLYLARYACSPNIFSRCTSSLAAMFALARCTTDLDMVDKNQRKEMISKKRHLAKALSWRVVGTVDTIIVGWIVTGDPLVGLSIGGISTLTKLLLYYYHERAWYRFSKFGVAQGEDK